MDEPEYLRSTRVSYDLLAGHVADAWRDELERKPHDRAMLSAFADVIRAAGGGPVTDVGCGAGRISDWLRKAGLDVEGIDLSAGMLAAARRDYPGLRFTEGDMLALDLPEESRAGIVAWYSIIHLPRERVPDAFAGFRRVLRPGGYLQLAFQAGDDDVYRTEGFGLQLDLYFRRHRPGTVTEQLAAAGLAVQACLVREPVREEKTPQAFILARRPDA
ncbi:MAG: class I SAM-dependent methyltransferase [Actinomycetia bacterium]|nr:class I SAM-dependent methyltransferase [Actinomycetes bacterium]